MTPAVTAHLRRIPSPCGERLECDECPGVMRVLPPGVSADALCPTTLGASTFFEVHALQHRHGKWMLPKRGARR